MAEHAAGDDHDLDVDWNTDDELEIENFRFSPPPPTQEKTEVGSSKSKVIDYILGMGFAEETVIKAIKEHGEENVDVIVNALLSNEEEQEKLSEPLDIDWSSSDDDNERPNENYPDLCSSSDDGESSCSSKDKKLQPLMSMGFTMDEASLAIQRCGENATIDEVADFIIAAQMARQSEEFFVDPIEHKPCVKSKKRQTLGYDGGRAKKVKPGVMTDEDEPIRLPKPMIGFGVPNETGMISNRTLPEAARAPPYFYYENVALAPKGVWDVISSFLYEVTPEFVDSKYFCAAARKRGYIHNLPIQGRYELQPPPKYTIHEAFPLTKRWWPSWDTRTKLNCLQTAIASAKLTERIRKALEAHDGDPPLHVQRFVIEQCRKWNLVWVGRNKVAPLEPDEMENLLGFPRNHTRGGGSSRTERYKSLGNSFQVDTVAYHLSVLKNMFPKGINVLSLFSGIGGAEVALHRLQIPMKVVVTVEISTVNHDVMKSFWEQTNQKGDLIHFRDVQELTRDKIEALMDRYGAFDLVIGGSPCNNLAGSNRVSRNGLEGKESSLFFDYCRILGVVRDKVRQMR